MRLVVMKSDTKMQWLILSFDKQIAVLEFALLRDLLSYLHPFGMQRSREAVIKIEMLQKRRIFMTHISASQIFSRIQNLIFDYVDTIYC